MQQLPLRLRQRLLPDFPLGLLGTRLPNRLLPRLFMRLLVLVGKVPEVSGEHPSPRTPAPRQLGRSAAVQHGSPSRAPLTAVLLCWRAVRACAALPRVLLATARVHTLH